MNARKAAFLASAWDDAKFADDEPGGADRGMLRDVVARQIDEDDPPEVWQTALRLQGLGLAADDVVRQLVLTLGTNMAGEGGQVDEGAYREALGRLPLPTPDEIERAFVDVVREHQPIGIEEVGRSVAARLGLPDDELAERLLERVEEELVDDGPLAMLVPDRLVHVPSMLDGVVLTHRLTDEERRSGVLHGTDLPGFARAGLTWRGEDVVDHRGEDGVTRWLGPSGWLDDLPPGSLLAVRVDATGAVSLTSLDVEPTAPDGLVAALRSAYDAEVDEPWLPVGAEDLLLTVLAADRAAFARPVPPLSDLAAAAGLEQRYEQYAHDASVWHHGEVVARQHRILDRLGPGQAARSAVRALSLLDESAGQGDIAASRDVLDELYDPPVLETVVAELLGGDDPTALADFVERTDRLLAAASRPRQRAVAGWLAAVADERRGRVLDAESHLRQAVREDPGWPLAEDRMAWYEADRGDAAAAVARWRRLGDTAEDNQDLETATRFAAADAAPRLGRNERCWCGSGRKYKACHLGTPAHARLPDRVNWLCRKPVAYLERRLGMGPTVLDHAAARAGVPNDPGDPDSVAALTEALQDPLVLDTVLHESGWFARFLAERGPLLPDDEALLARSWTLVERSVHEVLDVTPGVGLVLRDLRTGDRHDVRERSFSRQAHSGALVCARVVPDGESHVLIGGLFGVAPGTETGLLDLLEQRDGYALLHYVSLLHRPPTLVTTDGDPLVDCRADLEVPAPEAARAELDRRYESDGDGWVWFAGSRTVGGWLRMTGSVLSVRTMSESRLDAVCAELLAALPAARVTDDERRPFEPGGVPADTAIPGGTPPGAAVPPEIPREALLEIVDRQERSWCEEPVPALGGRTPREAADDPTRREELARLIASFPDIGPDGGMVAMRPERLRELLGLSAHRSQAEE